MCISGAAVDELLDGRCAARSGRAVPLPAVQAENSVHAASLTAGTRKPVSTSGRLLPVAGPGEPGNETWPGDNWKRGGGAARLTGLSSPVKNSEAIDPSPWFDLSKYSILQESRLWVAVFCVWDSDLGGS